MPVSRLMILLTLSAVVGALPVLPVPAIAQPATAPAPAADPGLPQVVPAWQRNQVVLFSTGAGAAVGVIVADIVTSGALLSPLGLPGAAALLTLGGAATAAPTYTIAQRILAGVGTVAAAAGGGYIGSYLARARPDIIRLDE